MRFKKQNKTETKQNFTMESTAKLMNTRIANDTVTQLRVLRESCSKV